MIYQYRTPDGRLIDDPEDVSMHDAPKIGSKKLIGGVLCERVASLPQVDCGPATKVSFPFHQCAPWYEPARKAGCAFLDDGTPMVEGKRQLDEVIARASHAGDEWTWNR